MPTTAPLMPLLKKVLALATVLCIAVANLNAQSPETQAAVKTLIDHGHTCLYTIPAEGGTPTFLASDELHNLGSPAWSPDNKWIAYDLWGPGAFKKASVAIMHSDGTNQVNLGLGGMPCWSPDGKKVVLHTYSPGTLVTVNIDGTERQQVANHWGNPRWMLDGNRIASIKQKGIAILDLRTGVETTVLPSESKVAYGIGLSPNSDRLAFSDNRKHLQLADLPNPFESDAITRRRLDHGITSFPSWSPDGTRLIIAWKANAQNAFQLYTLNADKPSDPQLLPGLDSNRQNRQPAWSPDGKTIVYASDSM